MREFRAKRIKLTKYFNYQLEHSPTPEFLKKFERAKKLEDFDFQMNPQQMNILYNHVMTDYLEENKDKPNSKWLLSNLLYFELTKSKSDFF